MHLLPMAGLVLATLCWGYGVVGYKALVNAVPPAEIVFVRFAAGGLALWLLVVATGRLKRVRQAGWRPMVMGSIEPFLISMMMIAGARYTSGTHIVVLWALAPTIAPLFARAVLKEPIGVPVMVAAAIAAAGAVVLVAGEWGEGMVVGDLIILASVFAGCANQLLSRVVATRAHGDPMATTALQLTSATLLSLAMMPVLGGSPAPDLGPYYYAILVSMGLAANALPFLLYNFAFRSMPVARVSLFLPLVSVFGTMIAALWLDEPLRPSILVALAMMLFAAFLPHIVDQLRSRPAAP